MERHLRSVIITIEITSRHIECTHINLDNSRIPAVALQCVAALILCSDFAITALIALWLQVSKSFKQVGMYQYFLEKLVKGFFR